MTILVRIFLSIFLLTACQTDANNSFHWKEDGSVTGISGKKAKLEIQGVYDSLDYSDTHYLAGFKIDKEGNNYPHIVRVSKDAASIKYWPFEKIPKDIFIYQENVQVITTDGSVYALQGDKWNLINKKFPRDSQVIYSGHKTNLIVCHPASMEKTGNYNSGCFATNEKWRLNFVWFSLVPKVCDGQLYVVEENNTGKLFKKVELTTGKILTFEYLQKLPDDVCTF